MWAIVAYDAERGIGLDGGIPWSHPEDLRRFAALTRHCPVIYGRRTWESLPPAARPLPRRTNIVLSRAHAGPPDHAPAAPDRGDGVTATLWVATVEAAVEAAVRARPTAATRIYVAGGEAVYREFLRRGLLRGVEATVVAGDHGCDARFPELGPDFRLVTRAHSRTDPRLSYETHAAAGNAGEQRYLDLVDRAIRDGARRADRTGVGTRSLFGEPLRFDLSNGAVPLLTTKRVFWRGVVEELLWFLRGDTDARSLSARGVRFWDANGTRAFLDGRGLDYPEGVLGPVYGHQWRRFGAPYDAAAARATNSTARTGAGADAGAGPHADQIRRTVELLRRDPTTRRAVLSAWNPNQLADMALPPCHVLYQWWVSTDRRLHCAVYQRSGDLGLGIPFNVASAALLTHLVARATGNRAAELVHFVADAHVYESHVAPLRRQLHRVPRAFPTVSIAIDAPKDRIWDTRADQIELRGYRPCLPTIKMPMAV